MTQQGQPERRDTDCEQTKRFMFPSQVRAKMKPMVAAKMEKGEDISYASSATEELVEAILRSQAYYEFTGPEKVKEVWRLKVHVRVLGRVGRH